MIDAPVIKHVAGDFPVRARAVIEFDSADQATCRYAVLRKNGHTTFFLAAHASDAGSQAECGNASGCIVNSGPCTPRAAICTGVSHADPVGG